MIDLAPDMASWALAWACIAAYVLYRHWRRGRGVGLLLTYLFSLASIHFLAPIAHLLPWFEALRSADLTAEGLRQSTLAMLGFAIGFEIVTLRQRHPSENLDETVHGSSNGTTHALINLYLMGGIVLYALSLFAGGLPFISAVISTGATLVAVSVALKCWESWRAGSISRMWFWLCLTLAFPLVTVVTQGFLGYGFVAVLVVASFVACLQRLRWQTVVAGVLLLYGGLSIYVTYMRDRGQIRDVVWGGEAVNTRFSQLQSTFTEIEWFDPREPQHLMRIDTRLNQNHLLGSAVAFLTEGSTEYAGGATLSDALIALIPRALWPDKPTIGGSGDVVTRYTGIRFAFGTSVGVGQVMELYINFATPGVILGFVLFGIVVTTVDRRAAESLARGDVRTFGLWYMPGLSLLQVGGALAEVTATAAASFALMVILNTFAVKRGTIVAIELPQDRGLDDRPGVA